MSAFKNIGGNFFKKFGVFTKKNLVWGINIEQAEPEALGMEYLSEHPVEGLFRHSGDSEKVEKIKKRIDKGEYISPSDMGYIHNIGTLIKMYFRTLPEPLLSKDIYFTFLEIDKMNANNEKKINRYKEVFKQRIPPHRLILLKHIMQMLSELMNHYEKTKMTIANYAVIFAPNLVRSTTKLNFSSLIGQVEKSQKVVMFFVENYKKIFKRFFNGVDHKQVFIQLLKKRRMREMEVLQKKSREFYQQDNRLNISDLSLQKRRELDARFTTQGSEKGYDNLKHMLKKKNTGSGFDNKYNDFMKKNTLTDSDIRQKEEKLRRKQEEIKRKEMEINRRAEKLAEMKAKKKMREQMSLKEQMESGEAFNRDFGGFGSESMDDIEHRRRRAFNKEENRDENNLRKRREDMGRKRREKEGERLLKERKLKELERKRKYEEKEMKRRKEEKLLREMEKEEEMERERLDRENEKRNEVLRRRKEQEKKRREEEKRREEMRKQKEIERRKRNEEIAKMEREITQKTNEEIEKLSAERKLRREKRRKERERMQQKLRDNEKLFLNSDSKRLDDELRKIDEEREMKEQEDRDKEKEERRKHRLELKKHEEEQRKRSEIRKRRAERSKRLAEERKRKREEERRRREEKKRKIEEEKKKIEEEKRMERENKMRDYDRRREELKIRREKEQVRLDRLHKESEEREKDFEEVAWKQEEVRRINEIERKKKEDERKRKEEEREKEEEERIRDFERKRREHGEKIKRDEIDRLKAEKLRKEIEKNEREFEMRNREKELMDEEEREMRDEERKRREEELWLRKEEKKKERKRREENKEEDKLKRQKEFKESLAQDNSWNSFEEKRKRLFQWKNKNKEPKPDQTESVDVIKKKEEKLLQNEEKRKEMERSRAIEEEKHKLLEIQKQIESEKRRISENERRRNREEMLKEREEKRREQKEKREKKTDGSGWTNDDWDEHEKKKREFEKWKREMQGYFYAISGVTITLLEERTNSSPSEIGFLFTLRSFGLTPPAIFIGFVYDYFLYPNTKIIRFYHITIHKIIVFSIIVLSIITISIPFISNFPLMCVVHFLQGFFCSILEIGCTSSLTAIWDEKMNPPIQQGLGVVFGIGGLVFPLIISQVYEFVFHHSDQLLLGYLICGTLIYFSIFFFVFISSPVKKEKIKDEPKKKKNRKEKFMIFVKTIISIENLICFLSSILKGIYVGIYMSYMSFLFQFGVRKGLDNEIGLSYLCTMFQVIFTIGSFIIIFLSLFFRLSSFLFITVFGCTICFSFLFIFNNNYTVIWIFTLILGFCLSPAPSGTLLFPEQYFGIKLNSINTGFLLFGQYIGEIVIVTLSNVLSGDNIFGPNGLMIVLFIFCLIGCVVFLATLMVGCIHNKRRKKLKNKESSLLKESEIKTILNKENEEIELNEKKEKKTESGNLKEEKGDGLLVLDEKIEIKSENENETEMNEEKDALVLDDKKGNEKPNLGDETNCGGESQKIELFSGQETLDERNLCFHNELILCRESPLYGEGYLGGVFFLNHKSDENMNVPEYGKSFFGGQNIIQCKSEGNYHGEINFKEETPILCYNSTYARVDVFEIFYAFELSRLGIGKELRCSSLITNIDEIFTSSECSFAQMGKKTYKSRVRVSVSLSEYQKFQKKRVKVPLKIRIFDKDLKDDFTVMRGITLKRGDFFLKNDLCVPVGDFVEGKIMDYENQLYLACENGDLEKMRSVFRDETIDINKYIEKKECCLVDGIEWNKATPLYIACEHDHLNIVKEILEYENIDVNKGNWVVNSGSYNPGPYNEDCRIIYTEIKTNPFYVACEKGYLDIVKELLKHVRINVNKPKYFDRKGRQFPSFIAVENGHLNILKELLKYEDFNVNKYVFVDDRGKNETLLYFVTTLCILAPNVDLPIDDVLMRIDVEQSARRKEKTFFEMIKVLLKDERINVNKGTFTESGDKILFENPLYLACEKGNLEIVKLLLELGHGKGNFFEKKINQKPDVFQNQYFPFSIRNPLYVACEKGHLDIVKELLKYEETEVNKVEFNNETPLYIACKNGNFDIVKELLKQKKIKVNEFQGSERSTPFYVACEKGNVDITKVLLKQEKLNFNKGMLCTPDCVAITHWGWPCWFGKTSFFKKNRCLTFEKTPLYVACENGNLEIVKILLKLDGIVVNGKHSEFNMTPLYIACKNGHRDVVIELLKNENVDVNEMVIEINEKLLYHDHHHPYRDQELRFTPLHISCVKGRLDIVVELLNDKNILLKEGEIYGTRSFRQRKYFNPSEIKKKWKYYNCTYQKRTPQFLFCENFRRHMRYGSSYYRYLNNGILEKIIKHEKFGFFKEGELLDNCVTEMGYYFQ